VDPAVGVRRSVQPGAAEEVCAEVELEKPDVVFALIKLVDKSVVFREGSRYP
jgi:hypothetical protein